ncbi:regulatory helix-turn-helix LysR family protein [Paraburkholderia sp. BL6669N2]|nr:regulatory helix-turn-helix LysR family protein [Paraburkholderia sp. BL6669N2]
MGRMAAMETYVSVVEAGSFSAAAKRLKLGQPAVSKSITQLEERLGVRLLLRSTRGLTPTDAGQRFYEHVRRAIEEVDLAEHVARDVSTGTLQRASRQCRGDLRNRRQVLSVYRLIASTSRGRAMQGL